MKIGDLVEGFASDIFGWNGLIINKDEFFFEVLWGNGTIRSHTKDQLWGQNESR